MPKKNVTSMPPQENVAALTLQEWDPADEVKRNPRTRKGPPRRCKICGKDPYPNYFYCPPCHHKLSSPAGEE